VANPYAFPTIPTWYYVTAVDPIYNCTTMDSALVLAAPASTLPPLINDTIIPCNQGTIIFPLNPNFTPIGSNFYEWNLVSNITPDPNSPSSDAIINTTIFPYTYHFELKVTNEFGCVTIDSVNVTVDCIFPTSPFSLTGKKVDGGNLLEWTTEPDLEASRFELERSRDGSTFELLHAQNPHPDHSIRQAYDFTDRNPGQGENFYRLKVTDLNGGSSYSEIILLSRESDMLVSIHPNPARDLVRINADRDLHQAKIRLMNINGQTVLETNELNGRHLSLQCGQLARGAYFLELVENGKAYRFKLMLQ
jgi:hypothetical protein